MICYDIVYDRYDIGFDMIKCQPYQKGMTFRCQVNAFNRGWNVFHMFEILLMEEIPNNHLGWRIPCK